MEEKEREKEREREKKKEKKTGGSLQFLEHRSNLEIFRVLRRAIDPSFVHRRRRGCRREGVRGREIERGRISLFAEGQKVPSPYPRLATKIVAPPQRGCITEERGRGERWMGAGSNRSS